MYLGRETVGKAYVSQQGLYYRITCRCAMSSGVIHRLVVACEGRQESLGVLVPIDQEFGSDTKIPVKRLGRGPFQFLLLPKHRAMEEEYVPLSPQEPFAYITKLRECYLVRKNGEAYAVLKK